MNVGGVIITRGSKEMDKSLKPCPFCGGEADKDFNIEPNEPPLWEVYCISCAASVCDYEEDRAVKRWNNRYE